MQRNDFWTVVLVVVAFSGFMMGYSVPPMVDVGYIGGGGAPAAPKTEIKSNLEEYYRKLQEQD